jgi:hypothetical protein
VFDDHRILDKLGLLTDIAAELDLIDEGPSGNGRPVFAAT